MRALREMWSNTLMVVLTALSAALYAAILIPFKLLPIIPGVTEVRPANAIPIVCSLFFGPAGAWGSAIGNTVGDFFFGLGPGTMVGMVGNFLYGFVPFAFWRVFFGRADPDYRRFSHWVALVFICIVASAACAFTIAWGIDVIIKGVPFAILGTIIFFNNLLMAVILGPPLLFALLPRVKAWGLLYHQVLPEPAVRRPRLGWLGVVLMTVGSLGGLGGGLAIATGHYNQPLGLPQFMNLLKPFAPAPAASGALSESRIGTESSIRGESRGQAKPVGKTGVAGKASATVAVDSVAPEARPVTGVGLGLGLLPALLLVFLGLLIL